MFRNLARSVPLSAEAGVGLALADDGERCPFVWVGARRHRPSRELSNTGICGHRELADVRVLPARRQPTNAKVETEADILGAPTTRLALRHRSVQEPALVRSPRPVPLYWTIRPDTRFYALGPAIAPADPSPGPAGQVLT